ncbi:uncharacterized protein B0T15DRAFT_549545 [Chaetomium strumarium]|uniref:NWD NACHT-NTPase N-terminal domain-containing protein n=1 Tax=Chaetomium strumarium TaxID=1170767 RepID=A0AAJ0GX28_9PEZI|nr:hypothetical protein B0T15DRAFT_549545 [Chaetomium strumarium]
MSSKSKFKRGCDQTSPHRRALTTSVITSETPSQPASRGPETSPRSLQERLWDEAYDGLKTNESKTVEAYEKILTRELKTRDPTSMNLATQRNEIEQTQKGRRGQMAQIVRAGLERTAKEAAVKEGIQDGMQAVYAVKQIVDTAVQASPEAAVAWVGICFALEGLTYVVSRMDWYWNLAVFHLDENRAETSSVALWDQLEKHMKSVVRYYRNRTIFFLRNILRIDNWDGNLDEIRNAEDAVRKDSEQYNTEQIKDHLQTISIAADSQQIKLQDIFLALQDEKKRQCLKNLRVTDPRDDKARIESTKGGLLEESYRWILDYPDFVAWRNGRTNNSCSTFISESSSSLAKWVVSSRDRPEIEQQLKLGGLRLELSLESESNAEQMSHAVNAYIDSKVAEI